MKISGFKELLCQNGIEEEEVFDITGQCVITRQGSRADEYPAFEYFINTTKAKQRPERLLPCKCGCKRREHWVAVGTKLSEILKCCKCGFKVAGRNKTDVHKKWNEAIRSEITQ